MYSLSVEPNQCSGSSCNYVDYCLAKLQTDRIALFVAEKEECGEGEKAAIVAGGFAAKSLSNSQITYRMVRYRKMDLERKVKFHEQVLGKCWLSEQRGEMADENTRSRSTRRIVAYTRVINDVVRVFKWACLARDHGWHDGRWYQPGVSCYHYDKKWRRRKHISCEYLIDSHENAELNSTDTCIKTKFAPQAGQMTSTTHAE
ncbi:hypothetical protein, variant [Phytophthora nicotianae CJ01A1]|uniref:Uncharacterized protein n=3 Tax=Phytophthora nicotianae TaxID=4792 RepID=W2XP83_PHYNI|nr:hypothetical protein, variant [Phytophthora nicotianae]ETO82799.1 hypothetical protein, variant [Phytophthora nicotianae P1976]ETP24511.1 hypothetical protein, variant [Phytophthora nicotianae CJ01A1]